MNVEQVLNSAGEFGKEASQVARTLAFSGFAVIWVFKTGGEDAPQIAREFYLPAYFFAACLALDLLQYVLGRIALVLFGRYKEVIDKVSSKDEFDYPVFIMWPSRWCWWLKMAALLLGYWLLIVALHVQTPPPTGAVS